MFIDIFTLPSPNLYFHLLLQIWVRARSRGQRSRPTGAPWPIGSYVRGWGACTRCTSPTCVYFRIYLTGTVCPSVWSKNPPPWIVSNGRAKKSALASFWAEKQTACGCTTAPGTRCSSTRLPWTTLARGRRLWSKWTLDTPWTYLTTIWPVCFGQWKSGIVWTDRTTRPPLESASPRAGDLLITDSSLRHVRPGSRSYSTSIGDVTPIVTWRLLPYSVN